jgi:hypothetical protein
VLRDVRAKGFQSRRVAWHFVVVEVTLHHAAKPFALLQDWLVMPERQFALQLGQLGSELYRALRRANFGLRPLAVLNDSRLEPLLDQAENSVRSLSPPASGGRTRAHTSCLTEGVN